MKVRERIQELAQQFGKIEASLGRLIADEPHSMQRMRTFIPRYEFKGVSSLISSDGAPESPWQVLDQVIEGVAPHCRSAMGLSRRGGEWHCVCLTHLGEFFPIPIEESAPILAPLAQNGPESVAVAQAQSFLKKAGWPSLIKSPEDKAYLFKPTEGQAVVVIGDLAPLWEADYVESLQRLILKAFAK